MIAQVFADCDRKLNVITVTTCEKVNLAPRFLFNYIRHFRIGRQAAKNMRVDVAEFAGCWQDMPEEEFQDFLDEIAQRRHLAFAGRKNREADAS